MMGHRDWDSDTLDDGRTGAGRFRRLFGRIFGDAENPLGWALTIGVVSGIRVRVHLLFVIYAIAQVLWSIPRDSMGVGYTAMAMGILFGIVLLHEFGHCFACRAVGGEADQILMWPLGGLASCAPPHEWRADLATTLGGPGVNVVLAPLFGLGLWLAGRGDLILFNPLNPVAPLTTVGSWGLVALWWAHYINLLILGLNVLLPMYPLDGGRILHGALWARMGHRAASEIAVTVGLVAALAVGVFALVAQETLLLGIAVFGAVVCWMERQRMRAPGELAGEFGLGAGAAPEPEEEDAAAARREERRRQREEAERAEVDRILGKIAEGGMESLSRRERRTLDRATKRSRRE